MIIITFLYFQININYFIERTDISLNTQNLSALVFYSGWERAFLSLRDTMGLGVGFQQFGILGDQGDAQEILSSMGLRELNLYDGGSTGAKFIGEFGITGLIFLLLYLINFIKKLFYLRNFIKNNNTLNNYKNIFYASCFCSFFIELFIRGIGYFSMTLFFILCGVFNARKR